MCSGNSYRLLVRLSLCATLLFVVGCGGGDSKNTHHTVHLAGQVTLDGTPIEHGMVRFSSQDGLGHTGGGMITTGKYDAPDVPKGAVIATFSASKSTAVDKDRGIPIAVNIMPEKYQQAGIIFDAQADDLNKNFELKSK